MAKTKIEMVDERLTVVAHKLRLLFDIPKYAPIAKNLLIEILAAQKEVNAIVAEQVKISVEGN